MLLADSDASEYLRQHVPSADAYKQFILYNKYNLHTVPTSMRLLGIMCDYGVRIQFPYPNFNYISRSHTDVEKYLVGKTYLSAEEAYYFADIYLDKASKQGPLSEAIKLDYNTLIRRAARMYQKYGLIDAIYGPSFAVEGIRFECDVANDRCIGDLKVTRYGYIEDHYIQILTYSMLYYAKDSKQRRTLRLYYPVQGVVLSHTIAEELYLVMFDRFIELLREGY